MTEPQTRPRPPRRRLTPRPEAATAVALEAPERVHVPARAWVATIAADLLPLGVPIETLTEHPENARRHTERDIPVLMESLRRYGQRKPIVAKRTYRDLTNVVIAGNGTRTA